MNVIFLLRITISGINRKDHPDGRLYPVKIERLEE